MDKNKALTTLLILIAIPGIGVLAGAPYILSNYGWETSLQFKTWWMSIFAGLYFILPGSSALDGLFRRMYYKRHRDILFLNRKVSNAILISAVVLSYLVSILCLYLVFTNKPVLPCIVIIIVLYLEHQNSK